MIAPDFLVRLDSKVTAIVVSLPVLDGNGRNVFVNIVREGGFHVERLNVSSCSIDSLLKMQIGDSLTIETYPRHPAMIVISVTAPATEDSTARAVAMAAAAEL